MTDLPLINKDLVDGYLQVTDQEAIEVTRRLAKEEGIFAGFSSGTNVAAARHRFRRCRIPALASGIVTQ